MGKILVVDDETMPRMLAKRILSPHYEVVEAASGAEAVEVYEREKPDMVLSDVMMPQMSGYELLTLLKEKHPGTTIPAVFVTADESEEGETIGLKTGASDYIKKPFKADVLLRRVENIMRQVEQVQELKKEAETDLMTGLLNKASSGEEIGKACARDNGALLMIDLDSFKLVNDLYGHEMGDRVLIAFADIIRSALRSGDIAGRIGGDEFVAFCAGVQDESVIAEKSAYINEKLDKKAVELMGEDCTIPLGASIGAAFVPGSGRDYEEVRKKADKALYRVKENGKHGFAVFESGERTDDKRADTPAGIKAAREILKERNDRPGALKVGFENFQTLYRFLLRSVENYHNRVAFLYLTFKLKSGEGEPSEEAVQRFEEIMIRTLRKSDIVASQGKNRFMALLPEADGETGIVAVERFLGRWRAEEAEDAALCEAELEIEDIEV